MGEYQDNSLGSRVFQRLREDILSGKYKEHDELRENTLGKEAGGKAGRPVRGGHSGSWRLEGTGHDHTEQRSVCDRNSSKDIRDIYILRSMLEGLCARWATEHITEEQLDELEEVILLSEFHMKKVSGNNADQVTDLDGKFHKILYEASDSRILSHVLMDFHKYVQQARRNSVVSEERARKSIREHKQILRAIRDNDADLAEQLANEHILHVMQNLKNRDTKKFRRIRNMEKLR